MGIKQIVLSFIGGVILLLLIMHFLKKSRIYPSYVVLWASIGLFLVCMPVLSDYYRNIAQLIFGIKGGDPFIYIAFIGFLLLYTFYLTVKICTLTSQMSRIISAISVIESQQKDICDLKK
jgi:hypothetical protein